MGFILVDADINHNGGRIQMATPIDSPMFWDWMIFLWKLDIAYLMCVVQPMLAVMVTLNLWKLIKKAWRG